MSIRRLLVVDDEPEFADVVRRVGESKNFVVRTLIDSLEFEETYRRFSPSVIVLDIVMPDMDGIEIVRWPSSNTAPVILTTGYGSHFANAAEELGSIEGQFSITTIAKPTSLSEIEAALDARG